METESEEARHPASEVLPFVQSLREHLRPVCQKVSIAGSLRRQKETVHDAEIVLLPQFGENLFEEATEDYPLLDGLIASLVADGTLAWDERVKRNGQRLKRFIVPALSGFVVEFYIADEANYGNILAIRTGNAEFSHAIMTPRQHGGLLQYRMVQTKGHLYRMPSWADAQEIRKHDLLPDKRYMVVCPTEHIFFAELGLPFLPPPDRNEQGIEELRRVADVGGLR